jgi:hypothetical protein
MTLAFSCFDHHNSRVLLNARFRSTTHRTSTMTTLETLPTELALEFATHLSQSNLRQLALVSSRLRAIAEEVLYRSPVLERLYQDLYSPDTIHRLGLFAHTLLRRPDLARNIRALTMVTSVQDYSTGIESYEYSIDSGEYDIASGVIHNIGQASVQWGARVASWDDRLKKGNGHAWAGLVVSLLPRLESLDIEILGRLGLSDLDIWDSRRYGRNPLQKLFGYVSEDASPEGMLPADLSTIPGLRSLRQLIFNGQELDISWCLLPNLERLKLTQDCFCPNILQGCEDSLTPHARPNITTMELEIETPTMLSSTWKPSSKLNSHFLSSPTFPALTQLILRLHNVKFCGYWAESHQFDEPVHKEHLSRPNEGSFDVLLAQLQHIAPTLRSLAISVYSNINADFLGFITPATSMTNFVKLTSLEISQDLLFGQYDCTTLQTNPPRAASQVLPPSLRYLTVLFPTINFFDWLNDNYAYLDTLQWITLGCDYPRGNPYRTVVAMAEVSLRYSSFWFKLHIHCSRLNISPGATVKCGRIATHTFSG